MGSFKQNDLPASDGASGEVIDAVLGVTAIDMMASAAGARGDQVAAVAWSALADATAMHAGGAR